jgi:gamma-glutamylcyclotransferase (GGCT)/AIG2-like uncharacterized protein YtfP
VNTPHGQTGTFLLFVYGTLKRDGCRHGPLARQRFRGAARTRPLYALCHLGGYPGLVACPDAGGTVHGELHEVDCALLAWLDDVEGAPELFRLEPVEIEDLAQPAWAYFYQGDPAAQPRIISGTWDNGGRP